MFTTPILFLVFNRPEQTRKVFAKIREIKPKYLYVAADGPRNNKYDDLESCKLTREIATNIDWECEVKTLFRDTNLGCGMAVSEAITWFFNNVNEGIILEDDILAETSFFHFCEMHLQYYRDDKRIMMISGFNHLGVWKPENGDYFFSQLGSIWGWATWKRAWDLNSNSIIDWEIAQKQNVLRNVMRSDVQFIHRDLVTNLTFNGKIDTWDYKWTFYRLANSGLSVMPSKNLVKNIGFGADATHTAYDNPLISNIPVFSYNFSSNCEVKFIYADHEFDLRVFNTFIQSPARQEINSIQHMKNLLKKNAYRFMTFVKSKTNSLEVIKTPLPSNSRSILPTQLFSKFKQYIPYSSSALDIDTLSVIVNDIIVNRRVSILELGSGFSTIVIAKLIQLNNLSCKFISVDHNSEWLKIMEELLIKEDLLEYVELKYMPLENGWYCLNFINYIEESNNCIDCLIIDGPPAYTKEISLSRIAALPNLWHLLNENCFILLDDTNREGEKEIIKSWEENFTLNFNEINKSSFCIKGKGFNVL